ncbi:uncharacterized protein LAESUDRAFT_723003 [Laetiporus sulphureus 93-53]|uniref:Uncharacterized protein n=1 Tax=Laetiporus sulphureus 93-53 TaxID=1314785 RepID=A0A165FPB1_9APHY|nr:uncharacterized protein LAESUDRAFT_723003 [Laetiporus sulphureus 93-53]KZT09271.1 hypothetical protein LAESUDRAFT_723003 [Laetiporus sulphureus 93-53]
MDTTPYDFPDIRKKLIKDDQKFKKQYQVVDRPPVTDHDINEEYLRDPPNNEPAETTTDYKARGLKRGARKVNTKQEDVRITKESALGTTANESSIYP